MKTDIGKEIFAPREEKKPSRTRLSNIALFDSFPLSLCKISFPVSFFFSFLPSLSPEGHFSYFSSSSPLRLLLRSWRDMQKPRGERYFVAMEIRERPRHSRICCEFTQRNGRNLCGQSATNLPRERIFGNFWLHSKR